MKNNVEIMKKYAIGCICFLILLGLDQWTKAAAIRFLQGNPAKPLLGDFFVLQYLENHGAAFGILQGRQGILIGLTVLILAAVIYFFRKTPDTGRGKLLCVMMVLLSAGAVGNLIDRIARGYVVDFLYWKAIDFPIFNLADCYVVIAAVVIAILLGFCGEDGKDAGNGADTV